MKKIRHLIPFLVNLRHMLKLSKIWAYAKMQNYKQLLVYMQRKLGQVVAPGIDKN